MLRWILCLLGHVALSHAPGAITISTLPDAKNPASGIPRFKQLGYLFESFPQKRESYTDSGLLQDPRLRAQLSGES